MGKEELVVHLHDCYESVMSEVAITLKDDTPRRQEIIPILTIKEFHKIMRNDCKLKELFENKGMNYYQEIEKVFIQTFNKYILRIT